MTTLPLNWLWAFSGSRRSTALAIRRLIIIDELRGCAAPSHTFLGVMSLPNHPQQNRVFAAAADQSGCAAEFFREIRNLAAWVVEVRSEVKCLSPCQFSISRLLRAMTGPLMSALSARFITKPNHSRMNHEYETHPQLELTH